MNITVYLCGLPLFLMRFFLSVCLLALGRVTCRGVVYVTCQPGLLRPVLLWVWNDGQMFGVVTFVICLLPGPGGGVEADALAGMA